MDHHVSDEILGGTVQPPRRTDEAAVLAAFREVTGWTDEEVLHYATCRECDPRDGDYTWYCENNPQRRREREEAERQEAARPPGESPMDHAVAVLRAALSLPTDYLPRP